MVASASTTIDQRFAQLIQQFGLTKNSFAMSLGKTASVVQHLIDGRNKPGFDLLCKVFEIYPNVSRDWLLLGRGPMLVGGEPAPRPAAPAPPPALEAPLEPIDLSEFEAPVHRRNGSGVAGTRLQPAEIAATLALAAAATQPAKTSAPPAPESRAFVATPEPPQPTVRPPSPTVVDASVVQTPAAPAPEPAPSLHIPPAPVAPAPVAEKSSANGPEAYIAAALHAQHLQHQLAMAEMRNQHLLDQQQMLREMLAMARQSMV